MIHFYYDNLNVGNAYNKAESSAVRDTPTILDHFKLAEINYKTSLIKDFKNSNESNAYVIELFFVDKIDDIFFNISKQALELLQLGKLKLIIYYPYEGFSLDLYNNWFLKLHSKFIQYNLKNTKKYFIYNNLDVENQYVRLIKDKNIPKEYCFNRVYGFSYFCFEYYYTIKNRHAAFPYEKVNLKNIFNKDKNFLSLNSKIRPHRLLLVSELYRRGLMNNSLVSFVGSTFKHPETTLEHTIYTIEDIFNNRTDIDDKIKTHLIEYYKNWQPLVLDDDVLNLDNNKVIPKHYESSYFSIVTETALSNYFTITEKTFKPIANYHPIIVLGCTGILSYLRMQGYQTFPELFDESYDLEEDMVKRSFMVLDQIEKFSKLPKQEKDRLYKLIHDKVLYNADLFYKLHSDVKQNYIDLFKEIDND